MAETTAKKLHLTIVTPTKAVYDKEVDMVIMQTIDGQIGVLAGHIPVTTVLGNGSLRAYDQEKIEEFVIDGGFAEIKQSGVTVLAESVSHPSIAEIKSLTPVVRKKEELRKGERVGERRNEGE